MSFIHCFLKLWLRMFGRLLLKLWLKCQDGSRALWWADFPLLIFKISVEQRPRKSELFPGLQQHETCRQHWEGWLSRIYMKIANDRVSLKEKVTARVAGWGLLLRACPIACHSSSVPGVIWWQGFWACSSGHSQNPEGLFFVRKQTSWASDAAGNPKKLTTWSGKLREC